MKDKDLKDLASLVIKTGSYKPKEVPQKPEHQPNKKELAECVKLDWHTMTIREVIRCISGMGWLGY